MIFANRARKLYPYLQGMILCSGYLWSYLTPYRSGPDNLILYILLSYAAVILVESWLNVRRIFKIGHLIFASQFLDAFVIMLIIKHTGGIASLYYLTYFPIVALISVYSKAWRSAIGAIWFGICFLAAVYSFNFNFVLWQEAILKLAAIWAVGMVSYSIAHHIRSSESKLLKTLDVLNERTWELESSQSQLSNIYETTRTLSGILNLEELLGEILGIAQNLFRYRHCGIYLTKPGSDKLFLFARLNDENRHIYEKPELYDKDISQLKNLEDTGSMIKRFANKEEPKTKNHIEVPLISRGKVIGIMRIVSESGNRIIPRERKLLMVFANSSAIAIDNSLLYQETQELTITDELTDLYNFRYFKTRLSDELKRADRYRQKLTVLMLDLDHFKIVNDQYGHPTGNIILQEVSGIIKQCVRDVDVVARYGGEEFTVILPQTNEEEAMIIAERIRETMAKNFFPNIHGRREIRVTVSIGGCTYPDGIHKLDQLLEKVDKALYRAKSEGRNLVLFASKEKKRSTEFIS